MTDEIPSQPTAEWYATEPLRGSGKHGNFLDDDFLKALQISKDVLANIRIACLRLLDEHADNAKTRLDLRTLWKGQSGNDTKKTMLDDLISKFQPVFIDTTRFNPTPSNWKTISRVLAEQCIVIANARRSRELKSRSRHSPTPSVTEPETSGRESSPTTPLLRSQRSSLSLPAVDQLSFLSFSAFTLNNVSIPIRYDDTTEDIAAWMIRPDGHPIEAPQYCQDVSFDKFKKAIEQELMTEEPIEIRMLNSAGEYRLCLNDHHLQSAITRWRSLYARSGEPPLDFFRISLTTETTQRGMY
jgi:hypothetical protein